MVDDGEGSKEVDLNVGNPPVMNYIGLKLEIAEADGVVGRMVVSEHSMQPYHALHGGVSALVTESLASIGACLAVPIPHVGVEVSCSHVRRAPLGTPIIAIGVPLKVGKNIQFWEVRLHIDLEPESALKLKNKISWQESIKNHVGNLVAVGKCTVFGVREEGPSRQGPAKL